LGPLGRVLDMIPGMGEIAKQIPQQDLEKNLKRTQAMINSMTKQERRNPRLLNGNRKRRIAQGSGTEVPEINQLLNQFREMQKMMKQLKNPRMRQNLMKMFGG